MDGIDKAFYDLTVKERDFERIKVDRLEAELAAARTQLAAQAESQIRFGDSMHAQLAACRAREAAADDQLNRIAEWNSNQARMLAEAAAREAAIRQLVEKHFLGLVQADDLRALLDDETGTDNANEWECVCGHLLAKHGAEAGPGCRWCSCNQFVLAGSVGAQADSRATAQRQRAIDSIQQYFGPTKSDATTAADIVDIVCQIFGALDQGSTE